MSEVKLVYRCMKDHWNVPVTEKALLLSRLMKDLYMKDKKKNPDKKRFVFAIPGISKHILSMFVRCCEIQFDNFAENFSRLDFVRMFNFIQAAHFFKIQKLMDMSCACFAMAMDKEIDLRKLDITNETLPEDDCSRLLRSRPKDTFINPSDFLDVHFSPFVLSELHIMNRGQEDFNKHFRKIVNFESLEDLLEDMCSFEEFICADPRAACRISVAVAQFLIKILDNTDYNKVKSDDIQRPIISILSRANFSIWGEKMQTEVLPVLVKLVHNPETGLAISAVIALTRIAYNFPDLIKVIVDWGVLEAARKAHDNQLEVYWSMEHLAKFLATICRGHGFSDDYNLSSEKVATILTILDSICCKWRYQYRMVHTFTCYALSYLSYGRCVLFEEEVWKRLQKRLVDYISFDKNPGPECILGIRAHVSRRENLNLRLAGSALGVVGHIMRWGHRDHMQSLTKVPQFWEYLESMLGSFNKFQKEALQIISNLAAKGIQIPVSTKSKVQLFLSSQFVRSDVKMEAAWAVFNITCIHNQLPVGTLRIDEYPG